MNTAAIIGSPDIFVDGDLGDAPHGADGDVSRNEFG